MAVCWGEDEKQALHTAYECWPNLAIAGELAQMLPVPAHFQQAARMLHEEDLARDLIYGNDVKRYLERLRKYAEAGFSRFCERELIPQIATAGGRQPTREPAIAHQRRA